MPESPPRRASPEEPPLTTVTIDDELDGRLRALCGENFGRVVAEATAETVRRWERGGWPRR